MKRAYPTSSIVNSYIRVENQLHDILSIIPYTDQHESVWSDALPPIILESCSLLDSLWNYQARQSPCISKTRFTLTDYFAYFGGKLSEKRLLFWAEEGKMIFSFQEWRGISKYDAKHFVSLPWWDAYNELKHDRVSNRAKATLKLTVHSIAGLFLALLNCEYCKDAIGNTNWLSGNTHNPLAHLGEEDQSTRLSYVAAETKLFSHAVAWDCHSLGKGIEWLGPSSYRFKRWIQERGY